MRQKKPLMRLSIPDRLRGGMMLKQANHFEVPDTQDGYALMDWWEKAAAESRDAVMQTAYAGDGDITTALKDYLARQV